MTIRNFAPAAALLLALLGAPCQAVTSAGNTVVAQGGLKQGVVEQLGGALRIGGKRYAFSAATTPVYDRKGARIAATRLAAGQTVAFSVAGEGNQARIKELWIVD